MTDDDTAPTRLTGLPSWLLTQTAAYAGRLVTDGLASVDARGYHFRVLATLDEYGPASQAALGRRSGIHLSDLVAAINELAARGLVERAPDLDDRRRNVVTLTATGRRQLATLDEQLATVQEQLLTPLSAAERTQLTTLLAKLLAYHRMSS
ncbi:MarR family winged helix-turn-helix transcriptional regulator [Catellatospora sichuanensis]|uniref:MarR family winged helix-turn-helix transcriptional regulator n=1 Tax=Catellatospora sichuanensis TaxID=1969805 RepID=UPI0011825377|nr:MarR family transcriptional regulator [Catellatospora sichuanensis]